MTLVFRRRRPHPRPTRMPEHQNKICSNTPHSSTQLQYSTQLWMILTNINVCPCKPYLPYKIIILSQELTAAVNAKKGTSNQISRLTVL